MIKNKKKQKETKRNEANLYNKVKNSLAESRTWTIFSEGWHLDHVATLPKR